MEQTADTLSPSELEETWERVFGAVANNSNSELDKDIRIALQFLVVSGRPVSLAEIAAIVVIDQRREEAVDDILNFKTFKRTEDEVSELLGPLINVVEDKGTKKAWLADSSLLFLLTSSKSAKLNSRISKYAFSAGHAHRKIAKLCTLVCQKSTLYHANLFGPNTSPFVEYAWEYWAYHLHYATLKIERRRELENFFSTMITTVSKDLVTYLDALCPFLSKPLPPVPGRFSDLEYVVSLRQAQKALVKPISDLTKLRKLLSPALSDSKRLRVLEELENTRISLPDPPEQTSPANPTFSQMAATNALSSITRSSKDKTSLVNRVMLDDVLDELKCIKKPTGVSKTLLDVARHLRILTLRLAVDPVYSALISSAGGKSFSPLHILIYTAQFFEQCGSFPYWSELGPFLDPIKSFRCPPEDPEYAPSKIVVFHFEWRERGNPNDSQSTIGRYVRPDQIQVEENPHENQLVHISTENEEQIKRLHSMNGPQYYKALAFYRVFNPLDDDSARLFMNPLAAIHMKKNLLLENRDYDPLLLDPDEYLAMRAPQIIRDAPVVQYLQSVPSLLQVSFVRWVSLILEVSGRVSRQVLAVHIMRLELAFREFRTVGVFFEKFGKAMTQENRFLWYLIFGLLLFGLRCYFLPSYGAYPVSHSWLQFTWAFTQPASYLKLDSWWGLWQWFFYFFRTFCDFFIAGVAVRLVQSHDNDDVVSPSSHTYLVFHHICAAERGIYGLLITVATLVSCALIMLKDPTRLTEIFRASIFYWFNVCFGLFMGGVRKWNLHATQDDIYIVGPRYVPNHSLTSTEMGLVQGGGGLRAILVTTTIHIACIILFVYQAERIVRWISFLLTPVTAPVKFVWNILTQHFIFLSQLIGVGILLGLCGLAFSWTHQFIFDPFDNKASLRQLQKASRLARSTLSQDNYLCIGEAPLGDATENRLAQQQSAKDNKGNDSAPKIQQIKGGEKIKEA